MKYTCPTQPRSGDDLLGCGITFEAEPDREGLVDCPNCGLWFQTVAVRPEDASEDILRSERYQAEQAARSRWILFMLWRRDDSTRRVLTLAGSREQAKRNVSRARHLVGNPDHWVVEPLTNPGDKVEGAVLDRLAGKGGRHS